MPPNSLPRNDDHLQEGILLRTEQMQAFWPSSNQQQPSVAEEKYNVAAAAFQGGLASKHQEVDKQQSPQRSRVLPLSHVVALHTNERKFSIHPPKGRIRALSSVSSYGINSIIMTTSVFGIQF